MSAPSLNDLVSSMLSDVRATATASAAASNARPKDPVANNPWLLQGVTLIESTNRCLHCASETTVSYGLVETFKHKWKDEIWETPLAFTSLAFHPDTTYLGSKNLGLSLVNGCSNCIDQINDWSIPDA